jgi:hypothetical protein
MLVPDIRCPALSSWSTLGGTLGGFQPSSEQKTGHLEDLLMNPEYHITEVQADDPKGLYAKAFSQLPEGADNKTVVETRNELLVKAVGRVTDRKWRALENRLSLELGATAGKVLGEFIFWSGKSHAPYGWLYKSRKDFEDPFDGLGLRNGEVQKARAILRGEKTWNGKTFRLVEEYQAGRRTATFFRVYFQAVAELLEIELSQETAEDFEWEDIFVDEIELSQETAELSQETPELSQEATTESTYRKDDRNLSLTESDEPAFAEPSPPEMNGKEEDKHSSPPVGDKRHSQEIDTPSQRTAGKKKVAEPVAPPKPNDNALLAEVKEILNPDSGRWHLATHVSAKHTAETVAKGIVSEDDTGEVVHSVPYEDVEAAIEYLRWEADEGNNRREGHPDGCGCLPCKVSSATNKDVGKDGK